MVECFHFIVVVESSKETIYGLLQKEMNRFDANNTRYFKVSQSINYGMINKSYSLLTRMFPFSIIDLSQKL